MGIVGEGEEAKILVAGNCEAESGAGELRKRLRIAVQKARGDRSNGFLSRLTCFRHNVPEADLGTTSRLAGRKPPMRSSVRLRITSGLPLLGHNPPPIGREGNHF
jgi:hypothetical protein